jgi:outer membrane protein assembly factor BamB
MVYVIDWKTGKIVWEREVHRGSPRSSHHLKNTYASETPVTDGERVYAYFGNLGLFVFEMDGKPVWSQHWGPFRTRYGWGTAASPVLYKERVYVVNDNDDQSFLAALDKRTGKQIWRVQRDEASNWSTPFIWENEQRTEIITSGTRKVRAYDLDGKVLWELAGCRPS